MSGGIGASSSRRGGASASAAEQRPQLLDAFGRNVTPRPLAGVRPPEEAPPPSQGGAGRSVAGAQSDYGYGGDDAQSTGGFTEESDGGDEAEGGGAEAGAAAEAAAVASRVASRPSTVPGAAGGRGGGAARQQRERGLTDAQLDALVTVLLRETETAVLFSMPMQRVLQDSAEHKAAVAANARYDAACEAVAKGGPELYPSRGVQTLPLPVKNKEVSAVPAPMRGAESQVDSWDIYDLLRSNKEQAEASDAKAAVEGAAASVAGGSVAAAQAAKAGASALDRVVDAMVANSLGTPGCLIDAAAAVKILPPNLPLPRATRGAAAGAGAIGASFSLAASTAASASGARGLGAATVTSSKGKGLGAGPGAASAAVPSATAATAPAGGGKVDDAVDAAAEALAAVRAAAVAAWAGDDGAEAEDGGEAADGKDGGGAGHKGKGAAAAAAKGGAASPAAPLGDGAGPLDVAQQHALAAALRSRAMADSLALVERAVQQNLYHVSHRLYRSGPAQDLLERMLDAGLKGGHQAAASVLEAGRGPVGHGDGGGGAGDEAGGGVGVQGHYVEGSAEEDADAEEAAGGTGAESVGGSGGPAAAPASAGSADEAATGISSSFSHPSSLASSSASQSALAPPRPGPSLLKLWTYSCRETVGLNVSCMAWNSANRDLLAVGYGPYDFAQAYTGRGLICVWNLSNPEFPQAVLRAPDGAGVTAIDFSRAHPSLLAAGLYDGSVVVYDVAKVLSGASDGWPQRASDQLQAGSHTEAVWQVKWVARPDAAPGEESIVSVSTDGRVLEWSTKKGMAFSSLMVLKRARSAPEPGGGQPPAAAAAASPADKKAGGESKEGKDGGGHSSDALGATDSEGLLSRTASGLAFDFSRDDPTQYFVGTEDGLLARCSTSYSEQYLDVVQAHSGPVNRVRLSPFLPSACLTASSDWSVRLWRVSSGDGGGGAGAGGAAGGGAAGGGTAGSKPAGPGGQGAKGSIPRPLTFTTDRVREAVADVAWSPAVATRFASVARDGTVQIWDCSSLQPLLDVGVTVDEAEWRAQLAADAAAEEAAFQDRLEAERQRRRAEEDGVEEDEDFEADVFSAVRKQMLAAEGRAADEGGDHHDDDDHRDSPAHHAEQVAAAMQARLAKGPPRKKLSCCLFADNTHVLLTGDASGAVDVYRIQGLGGANVLATSTSVPSVGTEEWEHQLSLLDAVLHSMG